MPESEKPLELAAASHAVHHPGALGSDAVSTPRHITAQAGMLTAGLIELSRRAFAATTRADGIDHSNAVAVTARRPAPRTLLPPHCQVQ